MMVLILLPFCSCLDVSSLGVAEQLIHRNATIHLKIGFAQPTTEGWESGETARGLLCIRMPAGWCFVEGSWVITDGKSGTVMLCDKIRPALEAGAEETTIVLCSDQAISRNDLTGDISAEIVLKTGTKSGLFSLLFLGGATDAVFSDVLWSNTAALRRDIAVN